MSTSAETRLLPPLLVRGLGAFLITAGLVLPFAVIFWRAAAWKPPPPAPAGQALRPELVILPTGTFLMGSPEDETDRDDDELQHEVVLTIPFAISRTEVTQGQYFAVMGERPVETEKDFRGEACTYAGVGDDLPVVCITWHEAVAYCNRLSELEGLEPAYEVQGDDVSWNGDANGYRLPTEAEWEYAARADTQTRWVGTDDPAKVCDYDNVADASVIEGNPDWTVFPCNDGHPTLAPVTTHLSNRWNLYGMGGNAAEWVWDAWDGTTPYSPDTVRDPQGMESAAYRVIRGGSWWYVPRFARVAVRGWVEPSARSAVLGFRVSRSPLPSAL